MNSEATSTSASTDQKSGFDAFVSYSHHDDARSAPILQRSIESALDRFFGSRSLRVFRDEANLPMSEDLWGAIASSLDQSTFFLLMASPGSRSSEWVEREVAHFLARRGGRDRIGIVLTVGKTPWTDEDYDPDSPENAIGPRVRELLTQEGREPRVVDLRAVRKPNGALRRNRRFRESMAEIVARIKGVDKDVVLRAHLRERRRRTTIFGLVVSVALLATAMAYLEFVGRREQTALKLSAVAYERMYREPLSALERAYRASEIHASEQTEAAVRDAHRVALKQMHALAEESVFLGGQAGLGWKRGRITKFVSRSSPDGRYELRALAIPGKETRIGDVYFVDHESGHMRPFSDPEKTDSREAVSTFGFFAERSELFVLCGYDLLTFDFGGVLLSRVDYANLLTDKQPVHYLADLCGGQLMIAGTTSGAVWLLNPDEQERQEIVPRDSARGPLTRLVTSETGKYALLVFEDESATLLLLSSLDSYIECDLDDKDVTNGTFREHKEGCQAIIVGRCGLAHEFRLTPTEVVEKHRYSHGEEDVREVVIAADGTRFITLSDAGTARVWKPGSERPLAVFVDQTGIDWSTRSDQDVEGEAVKAEPADSGRALEFFEDSLVAEDVIVKAGRRLLLGAQSVMIPQGHVIYEISDTRATPLIKGDPSIHQILEFDGAVWFAAHSSVYRLRGTELLRLHRDGWGPAMGTPTHVRLYPVRGKLWLGTCAGAYRIERNRAVLLTDRAKFIADIEEIDGVVWILALVKRPPYGPYDTSLIRMHGDRAREVHKLNTTGTDLLQFGDTAYMSAHRGTYRFDTERAELLPGSGKASKLLVVDGHLWSFRPDYGGPAYHIGLEEARAVPSSEVEVREVLPALGRVWLRTKDGPAYVGQADGSDFRPFPDVEAKVNALLPVGDTMWIATDHGAHRLKGAKLNRIPDLDLEIANLKELDGAVWIIAVDRAFRVDGDKVQTYRPSSTERPLKSVFSVSGRICGVTKQVFSGGISFGTGPTVELLPDRH